MSVRAFKTIAGFEIITDTQRGVQEGIWYADRPGDTPPVEIPTAFRSMQLRHGLFWSDDERHVISLAIGRLHYHRGIDYELYVFEWPTDAAAPDDVCCHDSFEQAQACALQAMVTNRWCSE